MSTQTHLHTTYDVIVVGGGHAGCEAAAAAANMGSKVLLITMDMAKFANMSCNPAMGGIAKGQIVREVDALGGYSGIVTDKSSIQFRMLNRSKGPAMWSPRAQCDRTQFSIEWRMLLEQTPNLFFWQDTVKNLLLNDNVVCGVETILGVKFYSKAVVLTTGTFMGGLIHVGRAKQSGGRMGDMASYGITEQLVSLGFEAGRMKTGTPARLDGHTIDFDAITVQEGDPNPSKFSYLPEVTPVATHKPCYIVYTTQEVHNILAVGFSDSPLFTGTIKGIGPRYCPSIEDKVKTFADKNQHQLFLEPEGLSTCEYYLSGFSSSLPLDIQLKALRAIKGFERLEIFRPGYAIEYDYFPPTQLSHTLETKLVSRLFFAGQINGTTGYEEAAAQGLMAGMNAHLAISGKEPFILRRDQAYIGVLIDDLVTKGVDEPYRMFTSRAEYRILLRQDNADFRLTELSHAVGLATKERVGTLNKKYAEVNRLISFVENHGIAPSAINSYLASIDSALLSQQRKLKELLVRTEITTEQIAAVYPPLKELIDSIPSTCLREVLEEVDVLLKYSGYIGREKAQAEKLSRLEEIIIPAKFNFERLNITIEAKQKLTKIRPTTIGQATRIPGVSPADISVLLVCLGR